MNNENLLKEVISQFDFVGEVIQIRPYGSGHINDTYLVEFKIKHMGVVPIILQRMNTNIFKNPVQLMENILNVTTFLRKKIIQYGGDPERETLTVILNKNGKPYCQDSEGHYWRGYHFITGATSYDEVKTDEDFYQSGLAFGKFQSLLSDFPAHTLYETIPNFHNTRARLEVFKKAVEEDIINRAKDVQKEIQFILQREELANKLISMQENQELPLRVTHNDTKLNNILIDDKTHQGLCIIDLDTVMPGLSLYDFGDSIRSGATTALEDEVDLSKVNFDLNFYEHFAKGFLESAGDAFTKEEIEYLPFAAKLMTFECGMRFLMDYLNGDVYFKIHRENHNLDRARNQFKLVSDMEKEMDNMKKIVYSYI